MKRLLPALALAVAVGVFVPRAAYAKFLSHRLGVGFNSQIQAAFTGPFADSISANHSLSVKYWATSAIGVQGLFGFYMFENGKDTRVYYVSPGGKFLYNIVQEENMNFYAAAGLGLIVAGYDDGDKFKHDFGFALFPGAGFEWFFQGLPNLGFSAEVGFQYLHLDARNDFGSYGGAFGTIGIHYYF